MKIEFSEEQKAVIVQKIKIYLDQELGVEIGQFDAEFLLEFFGREAGPYFYNKGLEDAQVLIENQMDVVKEALYSMEIPVL